MKVYVEHCLKVKCVDVKVFVEHCESKVRGCICRTLFESVYDEHSMELENQVFQLEK